MWDFDLLKYFDLLMMLMLVNDESVVDQDNVERFHLLMVES